MMKTLQFDSQTLYTNVLVVARFSLPLASEGWERYCFHTRVSIHRGVPHGFCSQFLPRSLVPGLFQGNGVPHSNHWSSPGEYHNHTLARTGVPYPAQRTRMVVQHGQSASCIHVGGFSCCNLLQTWLANLLLTCITSKERNVCRKARKRVSTLALKPRADVTWRDNVKISNQVICHVVLLQYLNQDYDFNYDS